MGKNFGKNISKSLTGKYGHKRIDHAPPIYNRCV